MISNCVDQPVRRTSLRVFDEIRAGPTAGRGGPGNQRRCRRDLTLADTELAERATPSWLHLRRVSVRLRRSSSLGSSSALVGIGILRDAFGNRQGVEAPKPFEPSVQTKVPFGYQAVKLSTSRSSPAVAHLRRPRPSLKAAATLWTRTAQTKVGVCQRGSRAVGLRTRKEPRSGR